MSKENFMAARIIFDFVKLKASIGVLGNQNTYGYAYPFYPGLRGGAAAVFRKQYLCCVSPGLYTRSET